MHTPTPGIQAFAFDFGGVLADFIDPNGMLRLAEVAHVPPEAFKAAWARYRNQLDSDEIAIAEYWSLVLDSCGSSVPRSSAIPLLQQIDTEGFSHMRPFMLRWVEELHASGMVTMMVSNMSTATYKTIVEGRDWTRHFDHMVISGQLGINKPDPRIFEHAVSVSGVNAGNILFFDDMEANVAGAKAAGMKALLVPGTNFSFCIQN